MLQVLFDLPRCFFPTWAGVQVNFQVANMFFWFVILQHNMLHVDFLLLSHSSFMLHDQCVIEPFENDERFSSNKWACTGSLWDGQWELSKMFSVLKCVTLRGSCERHHLNPSRISQQSGIKVDCATKIWHLDHVILWLLVAFWSTMPAPGCESAWHTIQLPNCWVFLFAAQAQRTFAFHLIVMFLKSLTCNSYKGPAYNTAQVFYVIYQHIHWECRWPILLHLLLILSRWTLTVIFTMPLGTVIHSHTVLSQPLYSICRKSGSVWSPVWVIATEQQHEIGVGGLRTVCGPLVFLIHE